ncbi:MAG TPA: cytochrome c [Candidatus Sulfotelmatobacter sp.]|nr:cytochrome c [Candidatus Sulfotelmatobacter sp.]
MSGASKRDYRLDQSAATDESLLDAHERLLGRHPDDGARYRLPPIGILFTLSALVLFSGTYLNRYAGHYSASIYNENERLPTGGAAAPKMDPLAVGEIQFKAVCITCHQAGGQGIPGTYPPLAGSEWVTGSPARVIRIVVYGLKGEIHVAGHDFNAAAMPVFGQQVTGTMYNWSDERIAAVLSYVRHAWGNNADAISPEEVTAVRKAVGDRKEMTEAELEQVK